MTAPQPDRTPGHVAHAAWTSALGSAEESWESAAAAVLADADARRASAGEVVVDRELLAKAAKSLDASEWLRDVVLGKHVAALAAPTPKETDR